MTPTPREVPVREAEIERIAAVLEAQESLQITEDETGDGPSPEWFAALAADLYDAGLRSQQYLDGLAAAIRALPQDSAITARYNVPGTRYIDRDAALLILEGARATDDEGQR